LIVDGASVFLNGLDCSGNDNGGALTVGADGQVSCSDDDSGAGGGGAFSGTGSLQDFFDNRYVHVEGDTMTGALTIFKDAGTATGNTLVVDTDGLVFDASERRVGIGTDTPDYTLDIQSGSTTTMRFRNDNGSGTVIKRTTSANTFTLENTVTQPASDITSAVSLAGGTNYVDVGSDSSLHPSYISLTAWVNMNTAITNKAIWGNDATYSTNTGFEMYTYGSVMYFDVGRGNAYGRTSYAYTALDTWVHFVGTYDGTTVRLYMDGTEVSTAALSGTMSAPTNTTYIGRHPTFGFSVTGEIDDARIYDRSLTSGEVSEIYNSGTGTPNDVAAGGLVGWWKFDENTGTTAADSSGNGNTGTLSGAGWGVGKIAGTPSIQTATIISSVDGALDSEVGIVKFGDTDGNTQVQGQELGFYTEGAQRIMVDSGGLVGVKTTTPTEELEVVGTISGSTIHAQDTLTSSGTLVFEGAASGASLYVADGFAGSGLADCDTAGTSKLLWDVTTERFSCGTDTDTTIADTNTNQLTTFSLTGDSGTPETIAQGNTLDIAGGAEITTAVSATDTITINITDNTVDFAELQDTLDLDASTTLNFGGSNFIFDLTSTGDFMVRDNGSAAFFVDDSGRIGIGTEDLVSNIELDVAANDTLVDLYLKRIDSTISNGTGLGFIRFAGTDGGSESSPLIGAGIQGQAAGTWATGDSPANLIFWTTPDSSSTLTERMRIRPDGKVGIGTATPNAKLHVTAPVYQTGAYIYSSGATVLALDNYSGTTGSGTNAHIMFGYRNVFDTELYRHGDTGSGGIVIKTQQTSTSDNAFRIITQNGSANNTVFKVRADGAVTAEGSFTGGGADLAEWFPTADPGMEPGDITCLDPKRSKHVKRCNSRELKMIGIYSTKPGFIGNSQMGMDGPSALIGLVGQVPVKVIGNVDIGDSITLSKTDSVGKRAGEYDPSICIAMEEHRGREIGAITCLLSRNTGSSTPLNEESVANYLLKSFKESMRLNDF